MLVLAALALLNFNVGVSLGRSVRTGEIEHIQLFGGWMPVHGSVHHQHEAQPSSTDLTIHSTQFQNYDQTLNSFGQGIKFWNDNPTPPIIPLSYNRLYNFNASIPLEPYLTVPPKPPQL